MRPGSATVEHCWEGCECASRCIDREMEQKGNFLQQRTGNAPALKHLTPEMIESRLNIGHLAVIAYAGAQAEGFSWIGSSASQLTRGRTRLWPPATAIATALPTRGSPPHGPSGASTALRFTPQQTASSDALITGQKAAAPMWELARIRRRGRSTMSHWTSCLTCTAGAFRSRTRMHTLCSRFHRASLAVRTQLGASRAGKHGN